MIALVCHDAGGAEILSSYVRQTGIDCLYALAGPACKIFQRKLPGVRIVAMEEAVAKADSVLCGTSWQSDIEVNAIKMARSLEKRSVAFIDHWVNYAERFIRDGEAWLPDEIWVGDSIAETMAQQTFPGLPIKCVANPYLLDIRRELTAIQPDRRCSEGLAILYVCEPIREHALLKYGDAFYWGYTEEGALRYFLSHCAGVLAKPIIRIVIRPHPSELAEKYAWAQQEFALPIQLDGEQSLLQDIVNSDVVVGCSSMALVVALEAGKQVISCIPPGGRGSVLPHQAIIKFEALR